MSEISDAEILEALDWKQATAEDSPEAEYYAPATRPVEPPNRREVKKPPRRQRRREYRWISDTGDLETVQPPQERPSPLYQPMPQPTYNPLIREFRD